MTEGLDVHEEKTRVERSDNRMFSLFRLTICVGQTKEPTLVNSKTTQSRVVKSENCLQHSSHVKTLRL